MTNLILPWPARLLAISFALVIVFLIGQLHGERVAGLRHLDYVSAQAAQAAKIAQAQTKVVVETQVKYVDRIKTIYKQGDTIEKQVPIYVTAADDAGCSINAGFVRVYDAAWEGADPGSAGSTDREPAGISLATVAETNASNAASCHAWREQALALRELYIKIQKTNLGR